MLIGMSCTRASRAGAELTLFTVIFAIVLCCILVINKSINEGDALNMWLRGKSCLFFQFHACLTICSVPAAALENYSRFHPLTLSNLKIHLLTDQTTWCGWMDYEALGDSRLLFPF